MLLKRHHKSWVAFAIVSTEINMIQEYRNNNFLVSTDIAKLDLEAIHDYLSSSYWAQDIPKEVFARSIKNSLCFGVYDGEQQIGLARVISDYATYAYLGDVYILESHRGQGLSKWLMECIMAHPDLQGLRRFSLVTKDAHGLYRMYGFTALKNPDSYMEIVNQEVYRKP